MATPQRLTPIGVVESPLTDRARAPKQGTEGAPEAWLDLAAGLAEGYEDLGVGTDIVVLTWLHLADRDVLSVHPRDDGDQPRRGVFGTRSPDRPNPIGLHTVRILETDGHRLRVQGLEAVDGTPIVDIKPVLSGHRRPAPPRTPEQRRQDTLRRLQEDVDAWVATADPTTGAPYMVPLSFLWDGVDLWVATPAASPTGRNLTTGRRARVGIGETRDVVLVEASATPMTPEELVGGEALADRFADATGFEPRQQSQPYLYVRLRPERVQAWREANELSGRDLMADGQWLTG